MLSRFLRVPSAALVAVVSTFLLASTTSQQGLAPISASLFRLGHNRAEQLRVDGVAARSGIGISWVEEWCKF